MYSGKEHWKIALTIAFYTAKSYFTLKKNVLKTFCTHPRIVYTKNKYVNLQITHKNTSKTGATLHCTSSSCNKNKKTKMASNPRL